MKVDDGRKLAVGADVALVERTIRRFGQSQQQRQQVVLVHELGLDLGEELELVHHTEDASTHGLGRADLIHVGELHVDDAAHPVRLEVSVQGRWNRARSVLAGAKSITAGSSVTSLTNKATCGLQNSSPSSTSPASRYPAEPSLHVTCSRDPDRRRTVTDPRCAAGRVKDGRPTRNEPTPRSLLLGGGDDQTQRRAGDHPPQRA